jgi:hypothetical protein
MSKLTGEHIVVLLDDSGGSPQDVSTDVESVDIPDEYDEVEMTGFSDGAHNSTAGLPSFPVELAGMFNPDANSLYQVLAGIKGVKSGHTLTVKVGQGAAPVSGDPEFEGEFWCQKMNVSTQPGQKISVSTSLRVYGATAPAWGTVA